MVWNNVKHGIVLMTGIVLESAREFADSLDDNISITLIDGGDLVSLYNGKKDFARLSPLFSD